jgi:orotate phosphoribosyltransferase
MTSTLVSLFKARDIIQYGTFQLKSGETSDVYVNIKNIISYPSLHALVCSMITEKIIKASTIHRICGTPYGAVSFTSYISIAEQIPMLFLRKETKEYGTRKLVEGRFYTGESVILIEDVVTSGQSVMDAARQLEELGLHVIQIISVFSRCPNTKLVYRNINGVSVPIEYLLHMNDINR